MIEDIENCSSTRILKRSFKVNHFVMWRSREARGADILLVFWLIRVSPAWVRLTADNYAARLVEAVDDLDGDHAKATSKAQVKKQRSPGA